MILEFKNTIILELAYFRNIIKLNSWVLEGIAVLLFSMRTDVSPAALGLFQLWLFCSVYLKLSLRIQLDEEIIIY